GFGLGAVALTALSAGVVFVQPNEAGVVISMVSPRGIRDQALSPGLHWIIPFAEKVIPYSIARETYTMSVSNQEGNIQGDDSIAARTLDGQEIFVDASVIYAVNPARVVDVHILWQNRYTNDLVRPQTRGVIRDVVSQYRVDEVVSTKRFEMTTQVRDQLGKKLADNGLALEDFVLRNITFSKEYAASVEQKQIAEQQAQQAKLVVEQKKQEAEQARQSAQGLADAAVISAKGDAQARVLQAQAEQQALQLIAQAIKDNPDLLTYQYISKLSPNIQTMLLPSNSPFVFPLPTMNSTAAATATPVPAPTAVPTPVK
ncbi:MAG TPA: prohibitin family protein, partial [Anaerolineaceae bacterium]